MYGPIWPFLLMCVSHDTRSRDFPRVDGLSTDTSVLGCHKSTSKKSRKIKYGRSYLEKFVLQTLNPKAVCLLEFYQPERNLKMNRNDFLFLFQFIPRVLLGKLPFYPSSIKLIN